MAGAFSPAQPAPVKLGAADPVERWRRHTLEGNQAFERGEDIEARKAYSEALAVAEELMLSAARAHDARAARFAPALYGISCNDIIALARRQNDALTAGIFLCKLAEGYLTLIESAEAPAALRSRCMLHLRVASAALCSYYEERGMWDAAETYAARANAAFFSVQRPELGPASPAPDPSLALLDATPALLDAASALLDVAPALLDATPVLLDASPAPPARRLEPRAHIEPRAQLEPPLTRKGPPPLPPGWGERQSELPSAIWTDPEPALDLSPPEPPPRRTLRTRLLDWMARPSRRSSRATLAPLGPVVRAK